MRPKYLGLDEPGMERIMPSQCGMKLRASKKDLRHSWKTGLNREALYRTLSKGGNPQLRSLAAILGATGLRLSVRPSEAKARKAA